MDRVPADLLESVSFSAAPVRAHHLTSAHNVMVAAWRRFGLICLCGLLSLAAAAGALVLMKKQYAAEAILQLNLDKRETGAADDHGPAMVLEAAAMVQGELKIIRSRLIARRVVERLHLADEAPAPPSASGLSLAMPPWLTTLQPDWANWRGWLGQTLGWPRPDPEGDPATKLPDGDPTTRRIESAQDEVLGRMSVESDNRSYLITIRFTSSDPGRAADIANALAEEYVARRLAANVDAAGKTMEWLDRQIQQTRLQLQDAEATVQTYRARSGLLELGSSETLDQQRLRDLSAQRNAATVTRNDAAARLGRVQEAARSGGVPSAEDLRGSPQIRALLDRRVEAQSRLGVVLTDLGPQHPLAMQAQAALSAAESALSAELRRAAVIAQGELTAAQRIEQDLSLRLDGLQQSMIGSKPWEAELRGEQAVTQILRDRLAALTRNRDQVRSVQQLLPVAATVLVPAERPRAAVSPKPIVVVPLALTGGLSLGLLLASVLERRDRGFQTGAEIEPMLGKRCLGIVPEVRRALQASRGRRAMFEASLLAETVRSAAAVLGMFGEQRRCLVVLVTSSVAGEGKTVFCRSLADALTVSGRRVLLVDGSPRRDTPAREAPPEAAVPDPPEGDAGEGGRDRPSLMTVRRANTTLAACNVFGTTEFSHLLGESRKHFDIIIIEGPAVLLVADSLVLGRLADTVIHVARWSSTKRSTVAAALARLQDSAVAVDGIVLTRVDLARHASLNAADLGTCYLKERRFYERLLRPARLDQPQPPREL